MLFVSDALKSVLTTSNRSESSDLIITMGPPPSIPEELVCLLCRLLLDEAIMLPCCANSTCFECAKVALEKSDKSACPICNTRDTDPADLIPNRRLRSQASQFRANYPELVPKPPPSPSPPPPEEVKIAEQEGTKEEQNSNGPEQEEAHEEAVKDKETENVSEAESGKVVPEASNVVPEVVAKDESKVTKATEEKEPSPKVKEGPPDSFPIPTTGEAVPHSVQIPSEYMNEAKNDPLSAFNKIMQARDKEKGILDAESHYGPMRPVFTGDYHTHRHSSYERGHHPHLPSRHLEIQCYNCQEFGHMARDCGNPTRPRGSIPRHYLARRSRSPSPQRYRSRSPGRRRSPSRSRSRERQSSRRRDSSDDDHRRRRDDKRRSSRERKKKRKRSSRSRERSEPRKERKRRRKSREENRENESPRPTDDDGKYKCKSGNEASPEEEDQKDSQNEDDTQKSTESTKETGGNGQKAKDPVPVEKSKGPHNSWESENDPDEKYPSDKSAEVKDRRPVGDPNIVPPGLTEKSAPDSKPEVTNEEIVAMHKANQKKILEGKVPGKHQKEYSAMNDRVSDRDNESGGDSAFETTLKLGKRSSASPGKLAPKIEIKIKKLDVLLGEEGTNSSKTAQPPDDREHVDCEVRVQAGERDSVSDNVVTSNGKKVDISEEVKPSAATGSPRSSPRQDSSERGSGERSRPRSPPKAYSKPSALSPSPPPQRRRRPSHREREVDSRRGRRMRRSRSPATSRPRSRERSAERRRRRRRRQQEEEERESRRIEEEMRLSKKKEEEEERTVKRVEEDEETGKESKRKKKKKETKPKKKSKRRSKAREDDSTSSSSSSSESSSDKGSKKKKKKKKKSKKKKRSKLNLSTFEKTKSLLDVLISEHSKNVQSSLMTGWRKEGEDEDDDSFGRGTRRVVLMGTAAHTAPQGLNLGLSKRDLASPAKSEGKELPDSSGRMVSVSKKSHSIKDSGIKVCIANSSAKKDDEDEDKGKVEKEREDDACKESVAATTAAEGEDEAVRKLLDPEMDELSKASPEQSDENNTK